MDYVTNHQRFNYILKYESPKINEFVTNPNNILNVPLRLYFGDGSSVSLQLKNIINSDNNIVYVYEIDGKTFFSEVSISDYILDSSKYQLFAKANTDVSSNGYLGKYEVDKSGNMTISRDSETDVLNIIKAHVNHDVRFMDLVRDGRSDIQFGVDQNIKAVNRGRNFVTSRGVENVIDGETYGRFVDYFYTKYNMSEDTVIKTLLKVINAGAGACSYADFANIIFLKFQNKSYAFKETFGFDMYTIENGKKVLNTKMLLMDIFVRANSTDIGIFDGYTLPKIFSVDPNTGERIIGSELDEFGVGRRYNGVNQVYMSRGNNFTNAAFKYLQDYGIDMESDVLSHYTPDGEMDIDALKEDIRIRLAKGEIITMSEFTKMIETTDSNGKTIRIVDPNQQSTTETSGCNC